VLVDGNKGLNRIVLLAALQFETLLSSSKLETSNSMENTIEKYSH